LARVAATGLTRTLPYEWYTDPAVLRLEQHRVFGRSWQYAARLDQVAEPGQLATAWAGSVPILLARARDGELRAFVNVCRHRGHVLCEEDARRETIQCPYHAWTYALDGSLRSAPRADREPGFDRDGLGLVRVSVEAWGPFVFVNPDAGARPLADALGELPALLAEGGIDVDALVFHSRAVSEEYACNWKVCAENFLECYHCAVAHPGFSAVVDVSPGEYVLERHRWHSSQLLHARGNGARGEFHFLWPNLKVNVYPGRPNLSIGPVWPEGPERSRGFLDYFFAPGEDEAWIRDLLELDDQVGREDTELVERVQRGVRSGVLNEGRLLGESEQLIAHFDALVRDALSSERS
jgi:phenylpropionate dioxygenase-like ring-hydroxylating dioxygenase large terminal subunit